jgi:hypothetical protein
MKTDLIEKIIKTNKHFDEVTVRSVNISNKVEIIEHSSQSPSHSDKHRYRLALALLSFMGLSVITILVQAGLMSHEQAKEIIKAIAGWMI